MKRKTKEHIDYLRWRCKMNWYSKYLKSNWHIDQLISGMTSEQMDYFINYEVPHITKTKFE